MGIEPLILYKCKALYLKKALCNGLNLKKSIMLMNIWKNITVLGCSYDSSIEELCWNNCPEDLKDKHLKVFKIQNF